MYPREGFVGPDMEPVGRIEAERNERDAAIDAYLADSLPESEPRIGTPMDPRCEVAVVVPAYAEREAIFRPLKSLAMQEGVDKTQYELILVVNNPPSEPERRPEWTDADYARAVELYRKAAGENGDVLKIVALLNGEEADVALTDDERKDVEAIRASGLRVHAIDKATPGRELPTGEANVGGARNRGVAEAVERFRKQPHKDGIVAQSDADVRFDPHYIENLIRAFGERPGLVGLSGGMEFDAIEYDEFWQKIAGYQQAEYQYNRLVDMIRRPAGGEARTDSGLEVHFSGANMASRAYATAAVGGVPRIAGGEDPEFGRRLAGVGKVARVDAVKTYPADRFSARTAVDAGHGQGMIRMAEHYAEGGLSFESLEEKEVRDDIRERVVAAMANGRTSPDELGAIFSYDGNRLLEADELRALSAKLAGKTSYEEVAIDAEMIALSKAYKERLASFYPRLPLEMAVPELRERIAGDGRIGAKYDAILSRLDEDEKAAMEGRRRFVHDLAKLLVEKRMDYPDREDLKSLLIAERVRLDLDDGHLDMLEKSPYVIERISRAVVWARGFEEVTRALESEFMDELNPPAEGSERRARMELQALYQAAMELAKERNA